MILTNQKRISCLIYNSNFKLTAFREKTKYENTHLEDIHNNNLSASADNQKNKDIIDKAQFLTHFHDSYW